MSIILEGKMGKRKSKKFLLAIQYYRAPTPLPEEWEDDLKNIKKMGFEGIQLRIQWRWNERKEGEYNFDDIDRLFDISEKFGLSVIIKFMMETAPSYIYTKYNGYRISPDGKILKPVSHGAFYVGGWLPCFDNPYVREKGENFIKEVVKRYKERENLILYNAWNEPRSRPGEECACEYSKEFYRKWLKERFNRVENLNKKFGKAWGSFEDIEPPVKTCDYTEKYLWRIWATYSVRERIRWVVKNIRKIDKKREIMTHVGMCLPYQDVLNDTSDDLLNSKEVDIYGTSLPHWTGEFIKMDNLEKIASFKENKENFYIINLIPDWIRGVKENFYSYEIYTNNWYYSAPDLLSEDLKFYIWSQISSGAKGICLWQYKPERFGNESLCSGLVNLDGKPTERSKEVSKILKEIKEKREIIENYKVNKSKIVIVYDFRSDLISRLEETDEENENKINSSYLYKEEFKNVYKNFFINNIFPDLIDMRKLSNILQDYSYPFIYLVCPFILTREDGKILKEYVAEGGTLITENALGFRKENTWVREHTFPYELNKVFGIRSESIPKREKKKLYFDNLKFEIEDLITWFEVDEGIVIGKWEDGKPAITINNYGKGKAIAIGFHPGLLKNSEVFFKKLNEKLELYSEIKGKGLFLVRKGESEKNNIYFLFNYENEVQRIKLNGKEVEIKGRDVKMIVEKKNNGKEVRRNEKVKNEKKK